MSRAVLAPLLALLIGVASANAALNEEPPKDEPAQAAQVAPGGVQPLLPKLWQSRAPVTWKLERGGFWASLGHSNTVLIIQPDGPPGRATRILLRVCRVEAFDAATRAPARVTPLAEKVFSAAELAAAKARAASHNLYIPGETFRYCLMTTVRFEPAGAGAFASASLRAAVIEFLEDKGTVPTTSKWIEPSHKADASWIGRERLRAPWTDGRPVGGRLEETDGALRFAPAAPRTTDPPEVNEPKLGARPEAEADAAADLEEKAEK
jgi:hypothetical protein